VARPQEAFRPSSIVNTSAMSYGSLSRNAVEAINRGAAIAGAMQNTGEGGISDHHRHGGDLIWQIGTGYFGCRDAKGASAWSASSRTSRRRNKLRAIEIKLSQGAKPGARRRAPGGEDHPRDRQDPAHPDGARTASRPAAHSAFRDVDSMLDFIERIADATGPAGGHQVGRGRDELLATSSRG
jgi:glutamate synthase domain-containing protein 2